MWNLGKDRRARISLRNPVYTYIHPGPERAKELGEEKEKGKRRRKEKKENRDGERGKRGAANGIADQ
jgi:hypothetical protein